MTAPSTAESVRRVAPTATPGRTHLLWTVLAVLTALGLSYHLFAIHALTPQAQEAAGGLAQKIFYFHVPAAYSMYLSGVLCFLGSAAYLLKATHERNALAQAGAEGAVVFGAMVLVSGPLWAKKAWGVYWTWDPRLTTLMLSVMLYVAMVVLRRFSGNGEAERKFAAAFGVLGTVLLPVVHYSVRLWGGNHPTVVGKGGGGLSPEMLSTFMIGFVPMTLLCILLVGLRTRLSVIESKMGDAEEMGAALGLLHSEESVPGEFSS